MEDGLGVRVSSRIQGQLIEVAKSLSFVFSACAQCFSPGESNPVNLRPVDMYMVKSVCSKCGNRIGEGILPHEFFYIW